MCNQLLYSTIHCRFIAEVNDRIDMLRGPSEVVGREHEDHILFRQDQDEQLLLWMQRYIECIRFHKLTNVLLWDVYNYITLIMTSSFLCCTTNYYHEIH